MKRLWWVRHGPTHERAFCGWRDVPADLSDIAAIARLDAYLPAAAPLVSSTLLRARATADALAGSRPRLPARDDLRELHFGEWEGLRFDEVSARDPDLSRAYWEDPGDIAPPGGESWNAAAQRIDGAVQALMSAAMPDLVIVAHMGVILTRLALALDEAPSEALGHRIDPLSVTCLSFDNRRWRAETINHIP
jgi:broad specificity phosphatase PhoE